MHLLKCDLKEVEEEMSKLNQKVKQLEMHLDMMNKHYFMHCIDRKSFEETNCVAVSVPQKNDELDNDDDWHLKFYNYE
jgi:hypothetical protein